MSLTFKISGILFSFTIFYDRFQSKSKGLSMACFDLLGTGSFQLIIGWESGKVNMTLANYYLETSIFNALQSIRWILGTLRLVKVYSNFPSTKW